MSGWWDIIEGFAQGCRPEHRDRRPDDEIAEEFFARREAKAHADEDAAPVPVAGDQGPGGDESVGSAIRRRTSPARDTGKLVKEIAGLLTTTTGGYLPLSVRYAAAQAAVTVVDAWKAHQISQDVLDSLDAEPGALR